MRKYWVKRYRFANEYRLAYTCDNVAEESAQLNGWEQITRKKAICLCVLERQARKWEPSFSGHADAHIYPFMDDIEFQRTDFDNYPWVKTGYFVERGN